MTKRQNERYSFKKTLGKSFTYLAMYGLPWLVGHLTQFYPEYMALSVGTILVGFANWLKNKAN